MLAPSGRGSSNVYLIDATNRPVIGNPANPAAGPTSAPERLSSGILVGREPHEPTFTRDGQELWVTVRGENRIAILDVAAAVRQAGGDPENSVRAYVPTVDGPAQVWFSRDGALPFVISQKVPQMEIFELHATNAGPSRPRRLRLVDLSAQDKPAVTVP